MLRPKTCLLEGVTNYKMPNAKYWANLHKSMRVFFKALSGRPTPSRFVAAATLLATPAAEGCAATQRAQQHGGIGQQTHLPGQPQTVQEHLAQPQLVFLKGLCGFNPRTDLPQQSLGWGGAQRQQAQQRLRLTGSVGKLPWTLGRFPAARAQGIRSGYPKPMPVLMGLVAKPLQGTALGTGSLVPRRKGRH